MCVGGGGGGGGGCGGGGGGGGGGETVYEVFALRGERYTQVYTISHNVLKKHKMIQKKYLCWVYAVFRHVSSDFRSNVYCCKNIH